MASDQFPSLPPNPSRSKAIARLVGTVAAGMAVAVVSFGIGTYVFRPPPATFHSGARSVPLSAEPAVLAASSDRAGEHRRLMPNSRPVPESSLVTGSVLGLRFSALTPEMRDRFGIDQGMQGVVVLAVDPDSDAAKKGLSTGDVIVAVGNKPVHAPADVTVRVKDAQYARRDSVLLLVTGRHGRRSVALMPGKGMNPDD